MNKAKYVFVTGGVCSSLGKGIVAASTAAILKSGGLRVAVMKLDPYLNVDPGTMSPFQHGEVFVLDDGAETDLDLGHYERFIDTPLNGCCTVTTGRVYSEVLSEERQGKYLGGTIQIVPHITNKIREKIETAAEKMQADVLVVEIGGTVGDIEAEPFLETLRQMKNTLGSENVVSMHATLLPYLAASKELKTKPTQLSVRELRRIGIHPDVIFCRADVPIPAELLKKVSYFCDVDVRHVLPAETVRSIYEVPLRFQEFELGQLLNEQMKLGIESFDMSAWQEGNRKMQSATDEVEIGIAGKYTDLDDAYLSVVECIKAAGFSENTRAQITWIDTELLEQKDEDEWAKVEKVDGVIVPGGFGSRGIEGMIQVAEYCRTNKKPYLGICLGSQIMAMEFARNVLGIKDAWSEEFTELKESENLIVHFMDEQRDITDKGATMRLGSYPCKIKSKTLAEKIYNKNLVDERHRHRYEFNNTYREQFEANGFVISGTSPDGNLVEIVEVADHPYMIGSQYHPELLGRPWKPHPLFQGLIKAVRA